MPRIRPGEPDPGLVPAQTAAADLPHAFAMDKQLHSPRARARSSRPRRAAGTRTALDVLRGVFGLHADPERDIADFRAGEALLVASYRRGGHWRQGTFLLHRASAHVLIWRPWPRGASEAVPATIPRVRPVGAGDGSLDRRFSVLHAKTDSGEQQYAVPTVDLPLVREALAAAR